jgi:hypothetical protein
MAGVAHYNVVKHFDFEKLPGAYQVARHFNVGFRRRCLPAGVIVRHHNGGGGGHYRQPKHFAWVNQNSILRLDTNQIMPLNAAPDMVASPQSTAMGRPSYVCDHVPRLQTVPDSGGFTFSRTSRTLRASAEGVNGFCKSSTPLVNTPCWMMVFSV